MTKSELIKHLKDRYANLYIKDIGVIVETMFDDITAALERGNRVELRGFGSFSTRKRKARLARNPKTGETVTLGDRSSVYFRAGKELRDRLNNGK